MRGDTIKIGEYYKAKYYDLIPKIENNEVVKTNGKIEYIIDTNPYYFSYREREVRETGLVGTFRGYKQEINNLGVYQTSKQSFTIYTSDTSIPFKIGGVVCITINGVEFRYTVQRARINTLYQNNITNLRNGDIDTNHSPWVIDLI